MPQHIHTRIGAAAALAQSAVLAATGPASAAKVAGGTFHDAGSFTRDNFCNVSGLPVDGSYTVDGRLLGRLLGRLQGPGSSYYEIDHTRVVTVFTREATGQTVTDIQPRKPRQAPEHHKTTATARSPSSSPSRGGERTYGDEGSLIASNSGQVRFKVIVDDAGTPSDPSDDTVLSSEMIFGSTGTNQDFCSAVLADWGIST
jgi:hypothetical protein